MKKLLLENDEDSQEMKLPPIAVQLPSNIKDLNPNNHPSKKMKMEDTIEKSKFCRVFDQAVARSGIKGSAPPKLIMRSFHGDIRKILLKIHRGSSLEGNVFSKKNIFFFFFLNSSFESYYCVDCN